MLKPRTDDAVVVDQGESSMTGRVKAHVDRRVDEVQQQIQVLNANNDELRSRVL